MGQVSRPKYWTKNRARGFLIGAVRKSCRPTISKQNISFSFTDAPCTFEVGLCGWQTFTNMSVDGLNVTRTWRIWQYSHYYDMGSDYSYFHTNGTCFR